MKTVLTNVCGHLIFCISRLKRQFSTQQLKRDEEGGKRIDIESSCLFANEMSVKKKGLDFLRASAHIFMKSMKLSLILISYF